MFSQKTFFVFFGPKLSPKRTANAFENRPSQIWKGSYSNHPVLGANCQFTHLPNTPVLKIGHPFLGVNGSFQGG